MAASNYSQRYLPPQATYSPQVVKATRASTSKTRCVGIETVGYWHNRAVARYETTDRLRAAFLLHAAIAQKSRENGALRLSQIP